MIAAAAPDREGVWPKRVILTQRAPKVAFPSGRFARSVGRQRRPEPPRNVAGRLFSAAGFHPALQRETK
jgi:hypothetical protein